VTASLRHAIRITVFASALLVALLFAEQEARAEELVPVSTPAPDPGGAVPPTTSAPPVLPPVVDPPAPAPDTSPPISVPPIIPGGSPDLPPSSPPPDDDPTAPSWPSDPGGESHEQVTEVITGGSAVANTGGNRGSAGGVYGGGESVARPDKPLPFSGTTGFVRTGNARGRGSVDENGIKQGVDATVTENGRVVVVQVAIVVNVGIGIAGSGRNFAADNAVVPVSASVAMIISRGETAAGGGSGGPTPTQINTGAAFATGNTGTTKVTQSLVLTGRDVSSQLASVLNLGVGVSNSGLNLALAAVSTNNAGGPKSATFVTIGGGTSIATGNAGALGNRSTSAVLQSVTVTASGNGNLLVVQRAVIVNFGLALANSGLNAAGAAVNAALPGVGDAQQLLLALLGAGPDATGPALLSGGSGPTIIGTGLASAIGNDTKTGIIQKVEGSVSGDDTARAIQDAWVGNFGIGVANSGGNGAGGLSGPNAPSLGAARDALRAFLGGLTGVGTPVQGLDASFQLGANLLQLRGDVSGTETLLDVAEPSGEPGSDDAALVVRQVTAVLNIGIAIGDSGHNVALASRASSGTTTVSGPDDVVAGVSITTGDARAVGSDFAVAVCQAIGDEITCAEAPPTPPVVPPVEPPVEPTGQPPVQSVPVAEQVTRAPVIPATLPFTGSPIGAELAAGSSLLIAGMLMARRRRLGGRR
jgi:hypothetical protein